MAVAEQTDTEAVATPAARRKRSFRPRYPAWLTAPSLLYYAVFFLGPMALLVAFSLATQRGFGSLSYGFDISQYRLIGNSLYTTIFARTLVMASIGSLLTIAVGYPLAYWMARYLTTYKMLALLLVVVPFWTSFLIRTYALKIILDPNGYLAKYAGLNILYTKYAVAVGLVYNYLPLFILPTFASLERMDWTLIEAATDLGARPLTAFRQITLRLTLPGVITGHRRSVQRGPEPAVRLGALDRADGGAIGVRHHLHLLRHEGGAVRCLSASVPSRVSPRGRWWCSPSCTCRSW
jgi:ABC-type spermidine/putrescine transport system permease subunit I